MIRLTIFCFFVGCLVWSCEKNTTNTEPVETNSLEAFTLFERLDSSRTGINFTNNTFQDYDFNFLKFGNLLNGGGVATFDYDLDGLVDVLFISNQEENRLYRNLGDWQFEDVTEEMGLLGFGGFQTGVNIVDINKDGFQDIYLCRSNAATDPAGIERRKNLLFINESGKSFKEVAAEYGLDSDHPSTQSLFLDYDGDGDLDCYLVNTPSDYTTNHNVRVKQENGRYTRIQKPNAPFESDQLLRNDGKRFVDVSEAAGISNRTFGLSSFAYDFNEDGLMDIYVCNDYVEPDMLWLNQGDGTFKDETQRFLRHTSHSSMGSDLADVNNDGLLDFFVVDMLSDSNYRRKTLETLFLPDRYNTLVRYGYGHQVMWNTLQINNGNGSFSEVACAADIAMTEWSWSPLFGDFDNDGNVDLHITNGYRYDVTNLDFLRFTADSIQQAGGINKKSFPELQDYLDLIPTQRVANFLFQNTGELSFVNRAKDWGMPQRTYSSGSALADLDNDGDLDLVVNNMHESAFIFRNRLEEHPDASQRNYLQVKVTGPAENPTGQGAIVTIRTNADQLSSQRIYHSRGFQSVSEPLAHFGLGSRTNVEAMLVQWPDGRWVKLDNIAANQRIQVDYDDAQSSGKVPDLNQVDPDVPTFALVPNNGNINFKHRENDFADYDREFLLSRKLSREGPALAVGDINGDGLDDFYIGGARGQEGQIYRQQPSGNFITQPFSTLSNHAGLEDVAAAFFDADADGDQDIFVVTGGNENEANHPYYRDRLYLNDGKGGFTDATRNIPKLTNSGSAVLPFDINQDGFQDLIITARCRPGKYPEADDSVVLLNDGKGGFTEQTNQWMPQLKNLGMITDLAAGDLDQDGIDEIVVVGDYLPITVFHRATAREPFAISTSGKLNIPRSSGWWNTVKLADLDGDAAIDIIVGNEGINSRLRPSPNEPMVLVAADFDGNGSTDPIHAHYEDGHLYPIHNHGAIIRQLSYLKKRYIKANDYATAELSDIFGEALPLAKRLEVEEVQSLIYYNSPNGFEKTVLPIAVQLSAVQDILVQDFDGDGRLDLMLVGNDWGTEIEISRHDASNGNLLLNQGSRAWKTTRNRTTNFWASGDVRQLTKLRTTGNNWLILVANNDDQPLLYQGEK